MQPSAAEDQLEALDLDFDVALATTPDERGPQLGAGQPGGAGWGGRSRQDRACVRARQATWSHVLEGLQEGGVVLPEQRAELIGQLLSAPDRILVGAGQDGDRLGSLGVDGQAAVGRAVGTEDIGQQHSIGLVRLHARDTVALAIAGHGQWIDGIDGSPGGPQARHQQAARGLDRDRNGVFRVIALLSEQPEQLLIAIPIVRDALTGQQGASLINEGDVVVILRPIDPAEHRHAERSFLRSAFTVNEPGTDVGALMAGLQARHPISRACRPQPAGPSVLAGARCSSRSMKR